MTDVQKKETLDRIFRNVKDGDYYATVSSLSESDKALLDELDNDLINVAGDSILLCLKGKNLLENSNESDT